MRLNSARQMWHDAFSRSTDGTAEHMAEMGALGVSVQKTCKGTSTGFAAYAAQSGYIQSAIATLPRHIAAYGHHLYSPIATKWDAAVAEALVIDWFETRRVYHGMRMTAEKMVRARVACKVCLHRYRRIHQGGLNAGIDPFPTAEAFRAEMDKRGARLLSSNWDRDWVPVIAMIEAVCSDLDGMALQPVARMLGLFLEAA